MKEDQVEPTAGGAPPSIQPLRGRARAATFGSRRPHTQRGGSARFHVRVDAACGRTASRMAEAAKEGCTTTGELTGSEGSGDCEQSRPMAAPSTPVGTSARLRIIKTRIRQLLQAQPFQPFMIRMANGREYRIDLPGFVLAAASDVPQVTIEEAGRSATLPLATSVRQHRARGPSGSAK